MDRKSFWKPLPDFRLQARAAVLSFYERGKENQPLQLAGVHLAFVPEDRLGMGLVGSMGMTGNMLLKSYGKGASPLTDMRTPEENGRRLRKSLKL